MKKFSLALSVALAAQMALPMALTAQAAAFYDVSGHWAQQDIERLSSQQILSGYPNGTFQPEGSVTRAEFAAMLVKALNLPVSGGGASFVDVPAGHWAAPSIQAAFNAGLITGYPGNMFRPGQTITRAEAMTILANAERTPLPDPNTAGQILQRFNDAGSVPNWARQPVADAVQTGIFANRPGSENRIDPYRPTTRAEVAAMMTNLLDVQGLAQVNQYQQQAQQGQTEPFRSNVLNQGALQGYIATVPAQTTFTATLSTPIYSETARVGDTFTLTIDSPLVGTNGEIVIPAGSRINGRVAMVEDAARLNRNAKMDLDFTEIQLPNGERVPIQGRVATEDGMLHGGTTKGRIYAALGRTAIGAGLGAALGTALGPLSGGEVGKGAIYGTAVGAGVGALSTALAQGKEVIVRPGDKLQIQLEQSVTVPRQ